MKKTTIAILISFLALFLRGYLAYTGPIEADEVIYFKSAVQFNLAMREGDWNQILYSTQTIEHPQFYRIIYAVGLMAGKPIPSTDDLNMNYENNNKIQSFPWWHKLLILRMISALFGSAAVFLVSLINPLAGLFLAINTFAIKYTSVIYIEALPAFTSLVALLAALKSIKAFQQNSKNWKDWGGWLLLSSLGMGMTAASKYVYAVVGIVIIITILIQGWKHKTSSLLGLAIWGLLSLVFFFMLDPVLWHSPLSELTKSINFNFNYAAGAHVREVGYPFWQPIRWLMISIPQQPNVPWAFNITRSDYFIAADSIIFILAIVGIPNLFKNNKPMFIWLVIGMAFLFIWSTKWPQYILLVLAPYCISAAYGADFFRSVLSRLRPRSERIAIRP